MTMFKSSLSAALAVAVAIGTAAPAMAVPIFMPSAPSVSSDVVQVQSSRQHRRSESRKRFERRGDRAYYNNHRGYRDRRAGYREYDGWWFPPAAFIVGAIFGGTMHQQPGYRLQHGYALSAEHVGWCQNRWRSYRISDNSYQPYNGPRRICTSPFG
jgi:hypothetical protein